MVSLTLYESSAMKYFLALALAFTLTPAFANDDDDGSGVLFKSILSGMGFIDKEKPNIDYRERPPLVLPPNVKGGNLALPAPQGALSEKNTNWPKDFDKNELKKEGSQTRSNFARSDLSRKLTNEELNRGRVSGAGRPVTEVEKPFENRGNIFSRALGRDNDRLEFKGEGERTSLIQPPPGYRTPSANQPFGPVGKTDYTIPDAKNDAYDRATNKRQ
jgi:hypothetical protein